MSRLFGLIINDPQRVACALYPARDALLARAAPEGWGLACFQGGEVLLQRHPKPLHAQLDFYKAAKDLRTDYIVGHVGDPGTPNKLESTQPYRFRSWVFAQSGGITPASSTKPGDAAAGILEHVPDFLRRNIRAHTAAEHVFHVFLAQLQKTGKLDDPNIKPADAAGALAGAIGLARKLGGGGAEMTLNAMATNGRIFLAARSGRPLFMRQISGIVDCRVCGDALAESERRDRRKTHHEHVRAVVLASEPETHEAEGWEELPDASVAVVSRELQKSIYPLASE